MVIRPFKARLQGGNEMTTSLLPNHTHARICKHLPELPPVVRVPTKVKAMGDNIMFTLAIPPLVQPVNRFIGLLPSPTKQFGCLAQARPVLQHLRDHPEEPVLGSLLSSLIGVALAFLVLLWPVVFAALILFLVVVTPFAAIGAGVLAILRRGRRIAGPPEEHHG
jgi:hypothetical protein